MKMNKKNKYPLLKSNKRYCELGGDPYNCANCSYWPDYEYNTNKKGCYRRKI